MECLGKNNEENVHSLFISTKFFYVAFVQGEFLSSSPKVIESAAPAIAG